MNKAAMSLAVAVSALMSTAARAATPTWYPPSNVRMVQVSNTDGVRVFGPTSAQLSGQASYSSNRYLHLAITSCAGISPCLIQVDPGVYDLGGDTLTLSPSMELRGSGADVTTIVSNNVNGDDQCAIGTVIMGNNSSVSDITIQNTAVAANGQYLEVAALVANAPSLSAPVTAKAEHIKALTGSDATPGGRNDAACIRGDFASLTINDSVLESHNNGGNANAISSMGGVLLLTNSKLYAFSNDTCHLVNDDNVGSPSTVKLFNVFAESSCFNALGFAMYVNNNVFIDNSKFVVNAGVGGLLGAIASPGPTEITNTRFIVSGTSPTYWVSGGAAKFATSQLPGNLAGLAGAKIVNSYDQNFNAIPNQ